MPRPVRLYESSIPSGNAYKVTLVTAFVPLFAGLYWKRANIQGALFAVVTGFVDDGYWLDLGRPLDFVQGSRDLVRGIAPSPALAGPAAQVPSTPVSLWCWLRGDDAGDLIREGRAIAALLEPAFVLRDAVDAFRHGRGPQGFALDLSGYRASKLSETG